MDFFTSLDDIKHSFHQFASQTAKDGLIIINGDMDFAAELLEGLPQESVSFGLKDTNDYYAEDIRYDQEGNASYTLFHRGEDEGRIQLQVEGIHNVVNSLSAIACAKAIGLSMEDIVSQPVALDNVLPWDMLDMGFSKEYLQKEYRESQQTSPKHTIQCFDGCHRCGVCRD